MSFVVVKAVVKSAKINHQLTRLYGNGNSQAVSLHLFPYEIDGQSIAAALNKDKIVSEMIVYADYVREINGKITFLSLISPIYEENYKPVCSPEICIDAEEGQSHLALSCHSIQPKKHKNRDGDVYIMADGTPFFHLGRPLIKDCWNPHMEVAA